MLTVSVRLPEDVLTHVDELASSLDRSRQWVVIEALRQYLSHKGWWVQAVREGLAEAQDPANLVDHEEVKAKWEARLAAAMDPALPPVSG